MFGIGFLFGKVGVAGMTDLAGGNEALGQPGGRGPGIAPPPGGGAVGHTPAHPEVASAVPVRPTTQFKHSPVS